MGTPGTAAGARSTGRRARYDEIFAACARTPGGFLHEPDRREPIHATTEEALSEWVRRREEEPPQHTVLVIGGVIALNRSLDADAAREIVEIFTEVVIAPGADDDAHT